MRAIFLTGQYALWTVLFSHRLLRNENLGLSVLHHQFNVDTFNGESIPNIRLYSPVSRMPHTAIYPLSQGNNL